MSITSGVEDLIAGEFKSLGGVGLSPGRIHGL